MTVVDEPHSSVLYRIGIEAITNAVRHGSAENVNVLIARNADAIVLRITDDGHGMPNTFVPGVGVRSMRERVAVLGGSLSITTNDEGGVSVTAMMPDAELGSDEPIDVASEAEGVIAW